MLLFLLLTVSRRTERAGRRFRRCRVDKRASDHSTIRQDDTSQTEPAAVIVAPVLRRASEARFSSEER
jgi:hypothetical protein